MLNFHLISMVLIMNYKIFILSYKSANKCQTYDILVNKFNISPNRIFIVIGNDDPQLDDYENVYSQSQLLIFNKNDYLKTTDAHIYPKIMCTSVYAKNFIEDFVQINNIKHFIIIDDDLCDLRFRLPVNNKIINRPCSCLHLIISAYFEYMDNANIDGLCFGGNNLYMGGIKSYGPLKRRMFTNIYFRKNNYQIKHESAMYEDLTTSLQLAKTGKLIFMLPFIMMVFEPQYQQLENENNINIKQCGLTELYQTFNSYERSFFTFMSFPQQTIIKKYKNIYNPECYTNYIQPKIISYKYKKLVDL